MKKILTSLVIFITTFSGVVYAETTGTEVGASTDTTKSLLVTYPLQGETFHPGDTVTVTWTTKNIPATGNIHIRLSFNQFQASLFGKGCIGSSWDDCVGAKNAGKRFGPDNLNLVTKNTGSANFTLPKNYLPTAQYWFDVSYIGDSTDVNGPLAEIVGASNVTEYTRAGWNKIFFNIVPGSKSSDAVVTPATIKTSKKGDKGANVTAIQNILAEKGFLKVKVDGRYGIATYNAVWAFQKKFGLKKNGKVDAMTAKVLNEIE